MRVIIPCAGQATRWPGVNKHLVKLCGEPVLHRTVRLLNGFGLEPLLVVENHHDPAYKIAGSSRRKAKLGAANGDIDKIASSLHLWDDSDDTLILYGDVWWSRPAIDLVVQTGGEWTAFGRISGAGGELFGFCFPAGMHTAVAAAVEMLSADSERLATAGYNGKPVRGGWALYRHLCGAPVALHGDHGHLLTIADGQWTDDMDSRQDWDRWCYQWAMADEQTRARMI